MGKIVSQPLRTLFQGVSRQPDTVRLPGQVQDANNVLFSVVTGGFTKRAGSKHKKALTSLDGKTNLYVYGYFRDADEQYIIVVDGDTGTAYIYDLDGNAATVTYDEVPFQSLDNAVATGAGTARQIYLPSGVTQITLTTTGITTATVIWEQATDSAFTVGVSTIRTDTANTSAAATITSGKYIRARVSAYTAGTIDATWNAREANYLVQSAAVRGFSAVTIVDTTVIANNGVLVAMDDVGTGSVTATYQSLSDLKIDNDAGVIGQIFKIVGDDVTSDKFTGYYVEKTVNGAAADGADDVYEETAKPDEANAFDFRTMSHKFVRTGSLTFTFGQIDWNDREVGDPTIVPEPDFVGQFINDMVFYRDRLALCADEYLYTSQAGDYFNMWPEKAIQVQDSDPVGRVAGSTDVNILRYLHAFRKNLWATSENRQFEIDGGNVMSPRSTAFDETTAFRVVADVKPVAVGDNLYFVSESEQTGILYEYYFDDVAGSNDAAEITKHAEGYFPRNIRCLSADTTQNAVLAVSADEPYNVYVYRFHWDGNNKLMSSWGRWELGDDSTDVNIYGMRYLDGSLYALISRNGKMMLESLTMSDEINDAGNAFSIEAPNGTLWVPRLDRMVEVTGTYSAGTGLTTWTTPYAHASETIVVKGPLWDDAGVEITAITYATTTTITAEGDYSAHSVFIGREYGANVRLSKQFVRDPSQNNRAITEGKLLLRRLSLDYVNSGAFSVEVTPLLRDTRTYDFTGYTLGSAFSLMNRVIINDQGRFQCRLGGNARDIDINITGDSYLPFTITSGSWIGFYNEVARQG